MIALFMAYGNRLIVNTINQRCIVSGAKLSDNKIRSQMRNPREVSYNLADGYARDYYTLVANKVLGADLRFLNAEYNDSSQDFNSELYGDNEDVIDAEYYTLSNNDIPKLALPYTQYLYKVPDMSQFHHGKKVKVIPKRKFHY